MSLQFRHPRAPARGSSNQAQQDWILGPVAENDDGGGNAIRLHCPVRVFKDLNSPSQGNLLLPFPSVFCEEEGSVP